MINVAVINWNTASSALEAARSFVKSDGLDARVTIIDNLSKPDQRELLARVDDPGIDVILADRNLGFGSAANLALRDGDDPLVCVSNSDVAPQPEALAEMAAVALRTDDAGMVGPVFPGRTHHYHSELPRASDLLMRSFVGSAGRRPARTPLPGEVIEVGQTAGACFVMRRDAWEEVGGFDDGYFLWYDDVDLAKRLVDAGRRNLVVGSAKVQHIGAESVSQIGPRQTQAIRLASLRRYIAKHNPKLLPAADPLLLASHAVRARGAESPPAEAMPPVPPAPHETYAA